jgi:hypothetical protein
MSDFKRVTSKSERPQRGVTNRISYSRGFPYGAPLAMIRGGATKKPEIQDFIKAQGFLYDKALYAWKHYLDRSDFGPILKKLRDDFGCEVSPKADMDTNYIIDLDDPEFSRSEKQEPEPKPKPKPDTSGLDPRAAAVLEALWKDSKK